MEFAVELELAVHAVERKTGRAPYDAYCFTQCSNGCSLGSLLFPRQDHHVQRCITTVVCRAGFLEWRVSLFRGRGVAGATNSSIAYWCVCAFFPTTRVSTSSKTRASPLVFFADTFLPPRDTTIFLPKKFPAGFSEKQLPEQLMGKSTGWIFFLNFFWRKLHGVVGRLWSEQYFPLHNRSLKEFW